jgi:hypothetical protein
LWFYTKHPDVDIQSRNLDFAAWSNALKSRLLFDSTCEVLSHKDKYGDTFEVRTEDDWVCAILENVALASHVQDLQSRKAIIALLPFPPMYCQQQKLPQVQLSCTAIPCPIE